MRLYEVYYLLENIPYIDRPMWDMTRILSLFVAQKFCKKQLKLQDIFALPWDDKKEKIDIDQNMYEENKKLQEFLLKKLNNSTQNNGGKFKDGNNTN